MKTSPFCLSCGTTRAGAQTLRCKACDRLYCEDCVPPECRSCGATRPQSDKAWFYSEGYVEASRFDPARFLEPLTQ